MCCSILGGEGYSDCITDVTHQSKNALGTSNPNGWRRQNTVSIIIEESQFSIALGYIHAFSTEYTAHILNVGMFYALKICRLATPTYKLWLSQRLTVRLI